MFEVLHEAIRQLRQVVAEFQPDRFDGAGARRWWSCSVSSSG